MSKSYWIIAVTFGMIALASLGQAQNQQGEANRSAQAEQYQANTAESYTSNTAIERNAPADPRNRQDEESRQREIADLVAQQGMNAATQEIKNATLDMRDYSFYSTLLVGFGTVLLVITLFLTWGANRAAIKAAMVSLRTERAWLRAEVVPVDDLIGSPESVTMKFGLKVENAGKSPAHISIVYYKFETKPEPVKPTAFSSTDIKTTIFPNEAIQNIIFNVEFAYPQGLSADLIVCIHYTDLLTNEKHWVERKFGLFAGKGGGPFQFKREIRLGVAGWGFYDDGQYKVDQGHS